MSTAMMKNDLNKIPIMDRFAKHLKYYEGIQKKIDAYNTKKAMITHRKDILEKQSRINYQREYNRLVGALSVNGHNGTTIQRLEDRKQRLIELGAKAVEA